MSEERCNKDCLNCKFSACIYDLNNSIEYSIINGKTVGLNERLRTLLIKRHVRQNVLALKTGITEATISAYVNGTRKPRADHIVMICKALHCSADWLLGMESVQPTESAKCD